MNDREKEKRIEQLEEDFDRIQPELNALKDNLVRYEIAAAHERQARDLLVATWRDIIHSSLKSNPMDYTLLHKVMDNMDNFLNRAGGRRK